MKFVSGKPAAVIGKNLLISDLHFGAEIELQQKGVHVEFKPREYAHELNQLKNETKTDTLIVLGDFKNNYLGTTQREKNALNELLHDLKFKKVIVVKGNHDGNLEEMQKFFPKLQVIPANGTIIKYGKETYGLFHGHAKPSALVLSADVLLCGHAHPGVKLGRKEVKWTREAWVVGNCNSTPEGTRNEQKFVIFPSFHDLKSAAPINDSTRKTFLNEIFNLLDAQVILLNGQRAGKIKYLK